MLIELSKEAHKIADAGFKNIQLLFIQILISERMMMMYMVPARDEIDIVPQRKHSNDKKICYWLNHKRKKLFVALLTFFLCLGLK